MTTDVQITDPGAAAPAVADMRLAPLAAFAGELEEAEQDAAGWRAKRNMEILRLRQLQDAPTIQAIAAAARVRHGYVSRIVQGDGRPDSGSKAPAKPKRKRRKAA